MTPAEFALRAVGMPWKRWASSWEACDCFGLVCLYFREVLGIDLGAVPQTDIASGFAEVSGWEQCGIEDGALAFMTWRDGAPTHCGVVMPGAVLLHAEGDESRPGSVRVTRLAVLERTRADLRFYRYRNAPC